MFNQSQRQKRKVRRKLINDEIEPTTYKKWSTKLSAEKGSLEVGIHNLSKVSNHLFNKLEHALSILTNLKTIYFSKSTTEASSFKEGVQRCPCLRWRTTSNIFTSCSTTAQLFGY